MTSRQNPFEKSDRARHQIWEMLVDRDIKAFIAADWSMVQNDFVEQGFMGVHGHNTANPDHWRLAFPTLKDYADEWLDQAKNFQKESQAGAFDGDPMDAIFNATVLRDIEINGDKAIVHKKFDGRIPRSDGTSDRMLWQTVYYCANVDGQWKITGFTGYLPNPMGGERA